MYCWNTSSENFAPSISGASRRTRYTSSRSLTVVPAISKIASLNIVSFFQIYLTNCFAQPHGQHFNREHHAHHNDEDVGYRSEEHTSELQSRFELVCRLLLKKK